MKRKKYIYTNRKHSQRAIMSTILGIISNVSLGIVIYLTYLRSGNALIGYGLTGLLAALFSVVGLILGIVTIQQKDYFRFFPVLGILLNLAALGFVAFLLQLGI